MFDNIRAKLLRFRDLTWKDLRAFNAWPNKSADFDPFSAEHLSSPTLRVGKATDEEGALCYCPAEQVFMVSAYVMRPGITPEQAQLAGDSITSAIQDEAQRLGISKLVLCLPVDHPATLDGNWRTVKISEQHIPQVNFINRMNETSSLQATVIN
jgi:hypothetical protein